MRGGRWRRWVTFVACAALSGLVASAPAYAQSGDPSKSGDLTGNFSTVVWLLVPLVLGLALLTAYVLGPRGTPDPSEHRVGGVSRALSRRESGDST